MTDQSDVELAEQRSLAMVSASRERTMVLWDLPIAVVGIISAFAKRPELQFLITGALGWFCGRGLARLLTDRIKRKDILL